MRKNFGVKRFLYPQPVLMIASYGEDGTPDLMNAAWGGLSGPDEISMCIGAGHKTTRNILARKAFTVSMADAEHIAGCDYVGLVSGYSVPDKFARAGFTEMKSEFVDAPVVLELPVCLECRLRSYDEDTHRMVGEIVNVSVDERFLDEDGAVNLEKAGFVTNDPFRKDYRVPGKKVGNAYKAGLALKG